MRVDSNWTTALYKSFTYLLTLNFYCVIAMLSLPVKQQALSGSK